MKNSKDALSCSRDQSGLGKAYGNTQKGWDPVTKDEEMSEHCERFTRNGPSSWRSLALLLIIPAKNGKKKIGGSWALHFANCCPVTSYDACRISFATSHARRLTMARSAYLDSGTQRGDCIMKSVFRTRRSSPAAQRV